MLIPAFTAYNPYIFLGISLLLLISVLASKASEWMGVPALLIFLVIGMLSGSEGPIGIWFDNIPLAQMVGTLALAYILFSGGLDTDWKVVKPVLRPAGLLATVGVLLTAVLVAVFAVVFLGFSWLEGLLLGSVMSSTDAAAVFSILRSRSIRLKGRLQPLLELESGSNDPMAVFLTVTMIQLLQAPTLSWWVAIPRFVWQMAMGSVMGIVFGKLIIHLINKTRLGYEGLYPVMTLALVLFTYGVTDVIGGNGFLAVYLAGMYLGNKSFLHKRSLMRFHNGIAWLMQIAVFLTLGLLVFPSHLVPVFGSGLLLAGFLMFVGRPVAVMLCLCRSGFSFREKLLISWVGLRGAVPIVLAMFPLMADVAHAEQIFNMVFFVVIASVLLQGKLLPQIAERLKLNETYSQRSRPPLEFDHTQPGIKADMVDIAVLPSSDVVGKRLLELQLPYGVLITLIQKENGEFFIPDGGTILQANDHVLVLGEAQSLDEVERRFSTDKPTPSNAGQVNGTTPPAS
ncbi:MAG: potassium/proton antiporter [Phycisphaerae bacterium]|nr:potassium/proton antiporter [Phycisphaerae bacterium]